MERLIISASFRQNSTSLALAQRLYPDASLTRLMDYNISFCRGCGGCDGNKSCVICDDMPLLLEKMRAADEIILAFPIYFDGVPAQLKAVIDRMQPLYAATYYLGKRVPKTKVLHTVSACGGKACEVDLTTLKYFADCLGATLGSAHCIDLTDTDTNLDRAVKLK